MVAVLVGTPLWWIPGVGLTTMVLPVARFAQGDDILNVIDFFAAERSSYITAQTVYLGGVN